MIFKWIVLLHSCNTTTSQVVPSKLFWGLVSIRDLVLSSHTYNKCMQVKSMKLLCSTMRWYLLSFRPAPSDLHHPANGALQHHTNHPCTLNLYCILYDCILSLLLCWYIWHDCYIETERPVSASPVLLEQYLGDKWLHVCLSGGAGMAFRGLPDASNSDYGQAKEALTSIKQDRKETLYQCDYKPSWRR